MKAKLELVLYAIAVGVEGESGRGSIDHHIEITTETELMYLPVSADILFKARLFFNLLPPENCLENKE